MAKEFLWTEKYRPQKVSECILPDRIKSIAQGFVDNKLVPNLLFYGPSGCGKTTLAMAICEELGWSYIKVNASKERGIDMVRVQIENFASTMSLTGSERKIIILDEADYITDAAQAAFRGVFEAFSSVCTFILTCNVPGQLSDAIHSRTTALEFKFSNDEKKALAREYFAKLKSILDTENVKYEPQVVAKLIEVHFPDFRRVLGELQKFSVRGDIDISILDSVTGIRRFDDLLNALKDKNFAELRKWTLINSDIDTNKIYKRIFDNLEKYFLDADSVAAACLHLAEAQYKAAFVANQQINLLAFLLQIVRDCKLK